MICNKCGEKKILCKEVCRHCYYIAKNKTKKYKDKRKDYNRLWRIKNLDKVKAYTEKYNKKPEVIKHKQEYNRKYRKKNKIRLQLYRKSIKEKTKIYNKRYRAKHKKSKNFWKSEKNYRKHKYKDDINFRMRHNISCRIRSGLQKNIKSGKTLELLGCSISKLKQHLEKQFKDNMSWNNYGLKGWHIDHIIPCYKFDLTKEEEQKKCFHYTNLQPLWLEDHIKKTKIDIFSSCKTILEV